MASELGGWVLCTWRADRWCGAPITPTSLERLKKYSSHSVKGIEEAVFLVFGFVSAQLQGFSNLRLCRSLAKNQKSSLRIGHSIFLTALAHLPKCKSSGLFIRR